MAVKKAGIPISAKKKSVEEMKKLSEKKKKIMMKEESEEEEEDDSSEDEEEGEDSEVDEDDSEEESEADANKSSDDDDDEEEDESEDNEDESEDDEDDDDDEEEDESEEDTTIALPKKQAKDQTPAAKSAKTPSKTPSKQSLLTSPQKNEVQSNKKTQNKKKNQIQNDSSAIVSPKKAVKSGDDSAKAPPRQQKDTSMVKGTLEKRKRESGGEEGSPKKPRTVAPVDAPPYNKERRQRDLRCLFVKQFPPTTTENELKALSPDILAVRIPGKGKRRKFAFLEFADEQKAEENYHVMEKAKIKGQKLFVDYVGEKSSKFQSPTVQSKPENKKRLYVSGLPITTTIEDIGKHFPNAMSIFMKSSGNSRFANVGFETDASGEEALKQNSSLKIKGHPITVMFSFANKSNRRKPAKRKASIEGQQQSIAKTNQQKEKRKKEEEDDNEDESDNDDDEGNDDESDDDDDDDSDE